MKTNDWYLIYDECRKHGVDEDLCFLIAEDLS